MSVAQRREAWLTGVGLVSALGEGFEAHRAALSAAKGDWLKLDCTTYAPFQVHPQPALDVEKQMSKRDARQMEPWQRLGVYAAGLALDSAGLKGDKDRLSQMHMIVSAGGGERDCAVDSQILSGLAQAANPEAFINERLMSDLRPTLFLAQLSNLLAGNISIVHGVIGSSRTFMGEEMAGVDAVRIAVERCHARQGDTFLVGGSYSTDRPDGLLQYEFAKANWTQDWLPVWERPAQGGGMILGSVGAFLVIEAREVAEARGVTPLARISTVSSDRTARKAGQAMASLDKQLAALTGFEKDKAIVVSGATGVKEATELEAAFLAQNALCARATGSVIGHGLEAAFPANIALAAMMVRDGQAVAPIGASASERQTGTITQALVTSVGHYRGEGMALVEAVK